MEQRSRSFPQSSMPYGPTAAYSSSQQHLLGNRPRQQYDQYNGSGNQQFSSRATEVNQYTDWNQTFPHSDLPYDQNFPRSSRNHSVVAPELDLTAYAADPESVANIDLTRFTTSATEGWRPPGFGLFRGSVPDSQKGTHARANGVVSEPLHSQQRVIEVSDDETSVVDSAYLTGRPSDGVESREGYAFSTNDQQQNNTHSAHGSSQAASSSAQSVPRSRGSTLHPNRLSDGKRRKSGDHLPPCSFCGYQPKNPSDKIKHGNRHTKPHKCNFPECINKSIGFATINDLDRHYRSSKHGLAPTKGSGKGYICAACQFAPESKPKWWPRRDNFKAHITRRHKNVDMTWLVNASERGVRPMESFETTSSYFPGSSVADPDFYQGQDLSSPIGNGQLPNQGEAISWPEHHAQLPSIDEVFGVGLAEAQHLADEYPVRHCATAGADDTYGDGLAGLSLLGAAAEMTSPTMSRADIPVLRVTMHDKTATKRASDDDWDHGEEKRRRLEPSSHNLLDAGEAGGPFFCRECGKEKRRRCDLRKHEKRHNRPYGCTFPRCYYRQGSRSDWRRHEHRQHRVHEAWKCTLRNSAGNLCHNNYNSRRDFTSHLQDDHGIPADKTTQAYCNTFLLGRDGHYRFWCGFCNAVIPNEKLSSVKTARDRMFDHIGDHFDKDRKHIQEYICQELKRPFGKLDKEDKRRARAEYNLQYDDSKGGGDLPSSAVSGHGLEDPLFG